MNQTNNPLIAEVVTENAEVVEQLKAAANELEVVHAVLSTKVPMAAPSADVSVAIERTDLIGQQLAETAEVLDKTTEKLREIASGDCGD